MNCSYRNSDLKINRYFLKFKDDINEAKKHGKTIFYNEIRKKNNSYYARKLQGDIYASHPPISERRITKFDTDKKEVTWFYDHMKMMI